MAARNRQAFERGREHRQQIKALLLAHARQHPLVHLTGKQVQEHFPHLALSTIWSHMAEIRREAESVSESLEIL
jgi:hypothetical protein